MAELPNGTVTFLLTDVEGSTALWEEAAEAIQGTSPGVACWDDLHHLREAAP